MEYRSISKGIFLQDFSHASQVSCLTRLYLFYKKKLNTIINDNNFFILIYLKMQFGKAEFSSSIGSVSHDHSVYVIFIWKKL